jgi:hypothetical protein
MNYPDVAKQTRIETDLLKILIEGLRSTLAWDVRDGRFTRKLATLRFITHSFQRHMEHLMALEEYDGYMGIVLETKPNLERAVNALKQDHDEFRKSLGRILHQIDLVAPSDQVTFNRICNDLKTLLLKLEVHTKKEADILREAFEQEEGGEG